MGFTAFGAAPPLQLQAGPPLAGYALADGTGTVVSWAVPDDGSPHPWIVVASQDVTAAETGGEVTISYTLPGGSTRTDTLLAGGSNPGTTDNIVGGVAAPGTSVTVTQATALTAGTATVWAGILGS